MDWFKNLRISKKILSSFAVVSFVTVVVGLVSYWGTSRITDYSD